MKPRIFLYNPPAVFDERDWVQPMPLNLLSVCSLIDQTEFDLSVVQEFSQQALEQFRRYRDQIVCVGISTMTGRQITNGLAVAREIRKLTDVPLVWGGYHPAALPDETLQSGLVDVVIRGYGEVAFRDLATRVAQGREFGDVPSLSFKRNGEIVHNPEGPVPRLNDLPPLPYHLFDVDRFFRDTQERSLHYISSRGCPHQCGFCADLVIYRRRWNALSAERVIADLKRLKEAYDYDTVRFYDSNLFVNEERIRAICEGVIEHGLDFRWVKCNGDAFVLSQYSKETLRLMRRAGVSNMLLGVESGYAPALRCIGKAANVDQNTQVVERLHECDISIGFSFMFGFPYDLSGEDLVREHRDELLATMRAIVEFSGHYVEGDYYLLFIFTPYPGVRLFERYRKLGYEPPGSFEDWGPVNLDSTDSPWVSPALLKLHGECLKINWFFMRKPDRKIFPGREHAWLRRYAAFWGDAFRRVLRRRIERNRLRLPVPLEIVLSYYKVKDVVQTHGWRGLAKRLRRKLASGR
jgi:radical SAM superfamily enzyme YgiQ (UPF0313 family)